MKKYSGGIAWLLVAVWTIIMIWTWYIAYQHLHWDSYLWFALLVTYFAVLFPIFAFADVDINWL